MSIEKDLETLNKAVGTKDIDRMFKWFVTKYKVNLDFQLFTNKYVVTNCKGARLF